MSEPAPPNCPMCEMPEILDLDDHFECVTCGHEWPKQEGPREVKDAYGNVLADGDLVAMIKDLKLKGSSGSVKVGTKVTNIKLIEGDHDIDCKIKGFGAMRLKSEFVRKA